MARSFLACFVTAVLAISVTAPAQGQERIDGTFYFKFGQGLSDFTGDAGGAENLRDLVDLEKFTDSDDFQYVMVSELGYRFSPGFSAGLNYQFGTYYFLNGQNNEFHTVQALGRYKLGARTWTVAPYVDLGINGSTGQKGIAYGPSVGGGLDIALNDQVSFFVESRLNIAFPDDAIDTHGPMGVPFDVLSALPDVGAEVVLRGDPNVPRVRRINGPTEVQVGEQVTYSARINAATATRPVTRTWTFGDGGTGSGLTATHTFRQPGTYTVLFEAENEAGSDRRQQTITVSPAPQAAQITSLKAAPNPTTVGRQVQFRAQAEGDPPLSYEWHFGDGEQDSGQSTSTHTYEETGEYTVRLRVSNDDGSESRTLSLHVDSARADPSLGPYTVQIGAFAKRQNAEEKAVRVLFDGFPARIRSIVRDNRILYQVWAGSFQTQEAAERQLREQFGTYAPDAFVRATSGQGDRSLQEQEN